MKKKKNTYKKSGVNINLADRFVEHIAKISKKNVQKKKKYLNKDNIGAFGSTFDISKIKIKDPLIINKIFEIKEKNLSFFNIKNGIIAIKNVKSKTADYKVNKETIKDINFSLSKSFFNDYSRYYIQILANKHKLKRNYKDLENFIGNIKSN